MRKDSFGRENLAHKESLPKFRGDGLDPNPKDKFMIMWLRISMRLINKLLRMTIIITMVRRNRFIKI